MTLLNSYYIQGEACETAMFVEQIVKNSYDSTKYMALPFCSMLLSMAFWLWLKHWILSSLSNCPGLGYKINLPYPKCYTLTGYRSCCIRNSSTYPENYPLWAPPSFPWYYQCHRNETRSPHSFQSLAFTSRQQSLQGEFIFRLSAQLILINSLT